MASRRARQRNTGEFRAARLPKIARRSPSLPTSLATLAADATNSMIRFDQSSPGLATLPFAAILLRGESATSSQIENLTVRAKRLTLASIGVRDGGNAGLVARNVTAMRAALDASDSLDAAAILRMHGALTEGVQDDAGTWRDEWVWIGGESPVTAAYVAPPHADVPVLIDDLVRFLARRDLDPTVHAAIAHAQFETIHPFTDGNGRTGRALVSALLRARGVTNNLTVPLSSGLLHDVDDYIAALNAYRAGDPGPIVESFANAADAAIANARLLADEITAFTEDVLAARRRVTPPLRAVLDLCCREPAFTAGMLTDLAGVSTPTAYRTVDGLAEAGFLSLENAKVNGQKVWTVPAVLGALDRFAARAGRRVAAHQ
ncbi:fic protein [Enemella dayhoffiae]|uniref:Fic protein n=1 Tax=Enemella dayhoffiae TaxID=2016507 RepID=A0A255H4L5_9ACTN|nr:Fic family protein [Enemella dayhoffiae]OYO22193.1 fic protein [Enemella dayhoffiae]